ncbi:MAG: peptidase [Caulobacteraceae bacterium]|nr:peptidase [Caulobacteraceae bacterium]
MTPRLHRLANGVRVICDPMPDLETLAVSVVAGRGARAETQAQSGWAHLLEHMVFKGAGDRSARDIVEVIEAAGGHINAATSYERTTFQVRALKGGLGLALEVLADLVLRPTLDAQELEREKSVIAQEIAEAADAPDDRVFDLAQARAFAGQSLGRPILGEVHTIGTADAAALRAFRARQYSPDRLVVSAAGAVDEDELLALVERLFGGEPAVEGPEAEPGVFASGFTSEARRLEQAHTVLLLPGVGARDRTYFSQRLFAEALGGGMSSRLFQEARERLGLAYAVDAYGESYADTGMLGIYAGTAAGDAPRTAGVAAAQLKSLVDGVEPPELNRCKAQLKASLFMARESPLARAEHAAGQTLLFDRLFSTAEIASAVDAVGPADIRAYGERLLQRGQAAGAVLGPKSALKAGDVFTRALFG